MRLFIIASLLLAAAGCASGMSKDECLYADWRAIGFEDGAAGRDATAVSQRRVACAEKAGVTPDMQAYLSGRDEGLDQFCRPANGFDVGSRGLRYTGVCQARGETAFVAAYEKGLTLHGLVSNLDAASRALARANTDLDNVEHQIAHSQAAIVNPATPNPERIDHLAEMKTLYQRRDKIRDSIPRLARDVDFAEAELEDFRAEVESQEFARSARPLDASY
ncbi:MAG: DUF2799 domain-containing protein [Parvularculaceae bacterium]|nr:DUF2799 domain-containing protein [Parvularculaceae bacterium]